MNLAKQYPYLSSEDWKRIEQRLLDEVIGADVSPVDHYDGKTPPSEVIAQCDSVNSKLAEQRQALHSLLFGGEDDRI